MPLAHREWIAGKPVGSLGASRVARIGAALELGRRIAAVSLTSEEPIRDAKTAAVRLIANYGNRVQETFGALFLDARHRILTERQIFIGTLNKASVSPRDLFRFALSDCAAALMLFHNHPSGDPSPSPQDITFTNRVAMIGQSLGVEVLDHLIVTSNGYVSMKERGHI